MKIKPILFSGPMVRALLDGRKTQTRRILKPQPEIFQTSDGPCEVTINVCDYHRRPRLQLGRVITKQEIPYAVGDVLWVRETWAVSTVYAGVKPRLVHPGAKVLYAATDSRCGIKDRPSIFMPRWASRLTLEVTGVKVERLHDISKQDAIAEGLIKLPATGRYVVEKGAQYAGNASFDPRAVYAWLWEEINGPNSYRANPWVVAVTFTVHQQNVDAYLAQRTAEAA